MTTGQADYPILGGPSIDLATFTNILQGAHSPAAGEASGLYNAATTYGVDPAVLLAVFQHESSFGTKGVATTTRNVGNLVYQPNSAQFGGYQSGRWNAYPTWTQGALDASRLLASSLYGRSSSYSTARTFPARWAPSSDGNNPTGYGSALVSSINAWRGVSTPAPVPAKVTAPAPAKPAAEPVATAGSVTAAAVRSDPSHGVFAYGLLGAALLLLMAVLLI